MKRIAVLLVLGTFAATAAASGDAARGAAKAKQVCSACHGAHGNSPVQPSFPRLAGQYEDYLFKALSDYKSGARKNAIMNGEAAGLSVQEMHDLAAYFSSQKGLLTTKQ